MTVGPNENLWFDIEQPRLLQMAGTRYGRELLNIDLNIPLSIPITKISKCSVTARIGGKQWVSDFRVGAKWGNVIRHRWKEFDEYHEWLERKQWREERYLAARRGLVLVGGRQDTFFPDPDPETDTVDGYCFELNGDSTWDTLRDTASSSNVNDTSVLLFCGIRGDTVVGDGGDWEMFLRSFILFNTGGTIPDGNNVDSATQGFVLVTVVDNYSGGMSLVTSSPASDTGLVADDYDQVGNVLQAPDILWSDMTADSSTYNDFALNATGLSNIAVAAASPITRFGYRELHDSADDEPVAIANTDSESTNIRAADIAGTNVDPRLVVTHSEPGEFDQQQPIYRDLVVRSY